MVKQSVFQSDTDTFLRFPQQNKPKISEDSIDFSLATAPSNFGDANQTAPVIIDATNLIDELDSTDTQSHQCTCLNLETLKCFEVVERQYEEQGVIFSNCIAIKPSNPAFPNAFGSFVLMGAPKGGFLEVEFMHPVSTVNALVTSSQQLVMSAHNHERKIVAQKVLPVGNLANSDSALPPNKLLSVKAKDIHSITFCAFDGQFTIGNFSFCF
ncbi:MAG: hypothetical protein IGS39_14485 [Calothrix sp. C42_A2020_038]|nr:hypothetical protein [Calothrix sp. C42_A2020_038]